MTPPTVVILGAGRSGTNALRDALCQLPNTLTWPCDEINYVWRRGNRSHPTDELTVEHARPEVRDFIHRQFASLRSGDSTSHIVEKTCANTLRVGFVHSVVPDAIAIHIVRDPVDAVASAMKRWTAPIDVRYLAAKLRYMPPADIAHYGIRYVGGRLKKLASTESALPTWGPRFAGLDELVKAGSPLHEVCATQWERCVVGAESGLAEWFDESAIFRLSYRDLVREPAAQLSAIAQLVGIDASAQQISTAASGIHASSLGSGFKSLQPYQISRIQEICCDAFPSWATE